MFGVPLQTRFDVRFVLFGIPVAITPFFWIIALMFSTGSHQTPPLVVVINMFAILLSILVHELGHALVIRYIFGAQPYVILHGFGGLTFHERPYYYRTPNAWGQILISFAGPAAGFLLSAIAFAALIFLRESISEGNYLNQFLFVLCLIGIVWGIFNLLPVYPLDGGQISREICQMISPRNGIRVSLVISIIFAIGLGLLALQTGEVFLVLLCGFWAYGSFQMLQTGRY